MDQTEFTTIARKIDDLVIKKQFLESYELIRGIIHQKEDDLTGEQVHYLLNLQSNTKYAAEAQMMLKVFASGTPPPKKGTRLSRPEILARMTAAGGPFQWTTAEVERTIDYVILHDMLAAHIEGNNVVWD